MTIRRFTPRSTPYSLETAVHGSLALDSGHSVRWDQEVADILQMRLPPQVAYDRWITGFARSVVEIACGSSSGDEGYTQTHGSDKGSKRVLVPVLLGPGP